jgi:hypothetical protein
MPPSATCDPHHNGRPIRHTQAIASNGENSVQDVDAAVPPAEPHPTKITKDRG